MVSGVNVGKYAIHGVFGCWFVSGDPDCVGPSHDPKPATSVGPAAVTVTALMAIDSVDIKKQYYTGHVKR